MPDREALIQESIMRGMSEGVMTIGFNGVINYLNPAALHILGHTEEELLYQNFALCFFDREENDAFTQTILDAVYDRERTHAAVVPYSVPHSAPHETKQLRVVTSYLMDGAERAGIIVVLGDMTELTELRDAVKAMERIRTLNGQLELRNKLVMSHDGPRYELRK